MHCSIYCKHGIALTCNQIQTLFSFKQNRKELRRTKDTLFFTSKYALYMNKNRSASIPDAKPFAPWNIHHKYPSVLSVGWMLEGMNEEVALSSFPLMGTNRVSLRVIACGRGEWQLQHSSYSQAIPLGWYLHLKHHTERWYLTSFVWTVPVGVSPLLLAVLVLTYRAAYACTVKGI